MVYLYIGHIYIYIYCTTITQHKRNIKEIIKNTVLEMDEWEQKKNGKKLWKFCGIRRKNVQSIFISNYLLTIQDMHQNCEIMRWINGASIISRVWFIYFRYEQRWVSAFLHYLGLNAERKNETGKKLYIEKQM